LCNVAVVGETPAHELVAAARAARTQASQAATP
jgi:hypothetical protein